MLVALPGIFGFHTNVRKAPVLDLFLLYDDTSFCSEIKRF